MAKVYPKHTPVAYLTDIITSHARAALAAVQSAADEVHAATRDSMNLDDNHDDLDVDEADDAHRPPPPLPPVSIDTSLDASPGEQLEVTTSDRIAKLQINHVMWTTVHILVA